MLSRAVVDEAHPGIHGGLLGSLATPSKNKASLAGGAVLAVDWAAVEAVATAAASLLAAIAGVFAYRTWRDASCTLQAQQEMLGIEQERWAEERHELIGAARRTAARLIVDTAVNLDSPDSGLLMEIRNDADVPFEEIVIEADPSQPQANAKAASFEYLISALAPGAKHDKHIALPAGIWWRVRYSDIGGRAWAQSPSEEFPYRID